MSRAELDFAIGLAATEGWNPGLHDADAFYQADPQGFLIALLDGRPIGCISAVSYGGHFGFIGLYIVVPEHRGKGYGIALWQAAMQRLKGHVIGLDGVVAQQANYRQSGFQLAYRNIRYCGTLWPAATTDQRIHPLSRWPWEKIATYDRRYFQADRSAFLEAWIQQPDSQALGFGKDGQLTGYGVIRRCGKGHKIGPLFADDPEIARALLQHLTATVPPGDEIYLDVPEINPAAVQIARELGLTTVFETARMYIGEPPPIHLPGVFGVTTFELG
ncbi:MAG TPA: GNAT family N-acetyltransferase [Candidatus Limnocylindria bacterium]|nr:GNAT family N-acetyltransferase [Candidatus Limnocylindria bacterium]